MNTEEFRIFLSKKHWVPTITKLFRTQYYFDVFADFIKQDLENYIGCNTSGFYSYEFSIMLSKSIAEDFVRKIDDLDFNILDFFFNEFCFCHEFQNYLCDWIDMNPIEIIDDYERGYMDKNNEEALLNEYLYELARQISWSLLDCLLLDDVYRKLDLSIISEELIDILCTGIQYAQNTFERDREVHIRFHHVDGRIIEL